MTEVADRPDTEDEGRTARLNSLKSQYRTLQEMEARQETIRSEIGALSKLDDPGEEDLLWQSTLIAEHDDLDDIADPLRKRAKDLKRIMTLRGQPGNAEDGVPQSPDLATRNVIDADPFRDLDRVSNGLVEPMEVRGRAQDAIEFYSKRGDLAHDFAENANRLVEDQFYGKSNIARHVLETGTPEYYEAFRAYLSDPGKYSARAALTLTSTNGGFVMVAAA